MFSINLISLTGVISYHILSFIVLTVINYNTYSLNYIFFEEEEIDYTKALENLLILLS